MRTVWKIRKKELQKRKLGIHFIGESATFNQRAMNLKEFRFPNYCPECKLLTPTPKNRRNSSATTAKKLAIQLWMLETRQFLISTASSQNYSPYNARKLSTSQPVRHQTRARISQLQVRKNRAQTEFSKGTLTLMVKSRIRCLNMRGFNSMRNTFIVMARNLNARGFTIFTPVTCSRETTINTCATQSIRFIHSKNYEFKSEILINQSK